MKFTISNENYQIIEFFSEKVEIHPYLQKKLVKLVHLCSSLAKMTL